MLSCATEEERDPREMSGDGDEGVGFPFIYYVKKNVLLVVDLNTPIAG